MTTTIPPKPPFPAPSPSPTPNDEPTQTVQMQLPPEVVETLTADPGGLTQPTATLIAAGFAVLAALVALAGVWWQVKSNDKRTSRELRSNAAALRTQLRANSANVAKQLEKSDAALKLQLETQASEYEKDRVAALARERKQREFELIAESAVAAHNATTAAYTHTSGDSSFWSAANELRLVSAKLALLHLDDVHMATDKLLDAVWDYTQTIRDEEPPSEAVHEAVANLQIVMINAANK